MIIVCCSSCSSTLNMTTVLQLVADLSNTTLKVPHCKGTTFRVKGEWAWVCVSECVSVWVCVCVLTVTTVAQSCCTQLCGAASSAICDSVFIIFPLYMIILTIFSVYLLLFICTTTCQITVWLNSSRGFRFSSYQTMTRTYAVRLWQNLKCIEMFPVLSFQPETFV